MNINIYYGGRGLINDPTLFVINKLEEVLDELHVKVNRYNLYENRNGITALPQTLKDADGVVLATTVEWYGIGGYMQQFLDACWLYGDKEKIAQIYMCPIVMSTTYGEREGKLDLSIAWEILGGRPCSGICGYIADTITLEMNKKYATIIEKKAENLYRTISQKLPSFPASNHAVKQMVSFTQNIDLTPQETERLSEYASDDSYVQRQKKDIQELTNMFKGMLSDHDAEEREAYLPELREAFKPQAGFRAEYVMRIGENRQPIVVTVDGPHMECVYGEPGKADVELMVEEQVMRDILAGRMTFQRAFMSGVMKVKGDFKILRTLDQIFVFEPM